MSYQEKRTIVSLMSGLLIMTVYGFYTYQKFQSGAIAPGDLKFWASTMLLFIGIGIAATIVIQIVFHILFSITIAVQENVRNGQFDNKELGKTIDAEMVTDEMDKLVELKSMRVGFIAAGIGFIAALVSVVFNYSPVVMINILFISFSAGSLLGGITQLFYYRRGI